MYACTGASDQKWVWYKLLLLYQLARIPGPKTKKSKHMSEHNCCQMCTTKQSIHVSIVLHFFGQTSYSASCAAHS